jgi:cardiolipin synthase (CMP-forming)
MIRHLPNLLSGLRLLAAPVAAWLILQERDTAALAVFAVACLSDLLDGFVARRWGFASRSGAWLDPAADKLLMILCLVALLQMGRAPLWLVLLVLLRDLGIALGASLAWALSLPLRVAPLLIGKAATAVLVVYIGAWLLLLAFDLEAQGVMAAAAYGVAAVTLLSAFAYASLFLRALFFGGRTA